MHFLEGPAGSGKTSSAVDRLRIWLEGGARPSEILILLPHRALGQPYHSLLHALDVPNALDVQIMTYGGLAQRALSLYWPAIAPQTNPKWDGRDPLYLTIETAQYYMASFVEPAIQTGLFDSIGLNRPRLIAQVLSNLSSAAINGYSLEEAEARLISSWTGHSSRLTVYQTAMQIARDFRLACLRESVLDFSAQIDIFTHVLLPMAEYQAFAKNQYRYLIVENAEELYPVALDFAAWLWPTLQDGFVIYDQDAGYRAFLGASPRLAYRFKALSETQESRTIANTNGRNPALGNLDTALQVILGGEAAPSFEDAPPTQGFALEFSTFYPQMLEWVAESVIDLVKHGVQPRDIVILAPYLGDSLRFTLFYALEAGGVPFVSHRPSRALKDEAVSRAFLTLMKLVYTMEADDAPILRADIVQMLVQFLQLDPIRAEILAQIAYRKGELGSFDKIKPRMQERITYRAGELYERLRGWIIARQAEAEASPPDHFIARAFDFFSGVDYGLHGDIEAGRVASELMRSARKFREVVSGETWASISRDYVRLVGDGVLAASSYNTWADEDQNAVLIAPAYTFLMRNRAVDYQFWVDVGSMAWYDRLEQPVTHPYVLHRDYPQGMVWTDESEQEVQHLALQNLLLGLVRRCRQQILMGFADLGEQGFEQRGPLLRIINRLLGAGQNADDQGLDGLDQLD